MINCENAKKIENANCKRQRIISPIDLIFLSVNLLISNIIIIIYVDGILPFIVSFIVAVFLLSISSIAFLYYLFLTITQLPIII